MSSKPSKALFNSFWVTVSSTYGVSLPSSLSLSLSNVSIYFTTSHSSLASAFLLFLNTTAISCDSLLLTFWGFCHGLLMSAITAMHETFIWQLLCLLTVTSSLCAHSDPTVHVEKPWLKSQVKYYNSYLLIRKQNDEHCL